MKYKLGKRNFLLLDELMAERGWKKTHRDGWQLFWGRDLPAEPGDLSGPRTINHLPGFWTVADKAPMSHLLEHARARAARAGDDRRWRFFPRTFEMPRQLAEFRAAAAADPAVTWIAKPAAKTSGGFGQFLFTDPAAAPVRPGWIVQQYLNRTHLLDGRKYSIRVFLLMTSLDPLVVHIYDDGLVKRMTLPYSDAPEDRDNRLLHLSNSGVQKLAPGGMLPRLSFGEYRSMLEQEGRDYDALWKKIRRVCTLLMLSGREQLLRARLPASFGQPRMFNLWGPDILVDEAFDPWILESNGNPALGITSPRGLAGYGQERAQKKRVLEETLRMTGVLEPGPEGDWPPRRFGGWDLLFPDPEAEEWAADWFPRERDRRLFVQLGLPAPAAPAIATPPGSVLVEDGLLAYLPARNRLVALNAAATSILFLHQEGLPAADIAAALPDPAGTPEQRIDRIDGTLAQLWSLDVPDPWWEPEGDHSLVHYPTAFASERTYALGGERFRVRFERSEFADTVAPVLDHLAAAGDTAGEVVDVIVWGRDLSVRCADESVTVRKLDQLADALHVVLLRRACASAATLTALRASAVAHEGRSLIIAAAPGESATPLVAALGSMGFRYLSDRAAILDHAHELRPLPIAAGVPPAALTLLPPDPAARLLPTPCRRRDGTKVHFLRPESAPDTPVPVAALIFLRTEPGAAPALAPVGPATALERLSQTGLELPRDLGADRAAALIDWLRRLPRFELRCDAPGPAAALLKTWIDAGACACLS